MIHLLASGSFCTVQVIVPLRTFVSTITVADSTTNFDIYTGAVVLPASGTQGVAIQPDGRLDEAGCCNKQAIGYREYFHVDVVNLPLKLV
jgi:hypothetical protein